MIVTPLGHRIAVRFARKPIWMPTAPSKLFRMSVLTREFYDDEEVEQIQKLSFVYKAQMESIQHFMEKNFYQPATRAGGIPADFIQVEKDEDTKIYEENELVNARIAKQKGEYFDNLIKNYEDKVIEEKFAREEAVIESSQQVSDYLNRNLSNPEACVTPDNFDSIVEKAIDNPICYEFFIDKSGRKYHIKDPR